MPNDDPQDTFVYNSLTLMADSYIIRWKGHGHKTIRLRFWRERERERERVRERGNRLMVLLQLFESHTAEAHSSWDDEETYNAKSQKTRGRT